MTKHDIVFWHPDDDLLAGMTYQELITTVQCNEKHHTLAAIERAFEEILRIKIRDAREQFGANFSKIKKELK